MAQRASRLACLVLVGLIGGCGGQAGGEQQQAGAPGGASAGGEWRSSGCAAARSPVMTHTAGVTFPLADDRIQELVKNVTEAGQARFAAVYAGLELTPDQVRLVVYRKPSAEFDAYLRAAAGSECVIIRDAAHSQVELAALTDRITDDFAYWRSRGIAINVAGPKNDGSGVQVGTQDVTAAQVELPKRYGTAIPITVVHEGPVVPLVGSGPAR